MKKFTAAASALLAFSISSSAMADACSQLTPARFAAFNAALATASAAGAAANAAALPYSTGAFNQSSMDELTLVWSTLNMASHLTTVPISNYASMAPYLTAQFGFELNSRIGHVRYWADINRWYNRASSPNTPAIAPAQIALDAINAVQRKVQRINELASQCMGEMAW